MRGQTAKYKCKWCKKEFTARTADRKRGWARFCSKHCKAMEQEKRTGQYSKMRTESVYDEAMTAQGFADFLECGDK